jgi:DNA-binding SARP family transcriptional activator
LADVAGVVWFDAQADRLDAWRVDTVLELAGVRLDLGEHATVVPELLGLADSHPYREDVHRQLMVALYRAGRQGEALSVFRDLRGRLAEDLGIDPSGRLRDLEAAILRQDRALDLPPERVTVSISDAAGG